MNEKQALEAVKEQLTEHRYQHTLGVLESATELCNHFGGNLAKVRLAAILHDYAKFRPKDEMRRILEKEDFPDDLLTHGTELWHAPVGAYLVSNELGLDDLEIQSAIRWHTTGKPNMSLTEKIIFLADYIEPGRHFPGVDEVRELAKISLDKAIIQSISNTIQFLVKKGQPVYPDTILTYNHLILHNQKV